MSNSEKEHPICRRCLYGIKRYFSFGNKIILYRVSGCTHVMRRSEEEKPFNEKSKCLFFEKDKIPLPSH